MFQLGKASEDFKCIEKLHFGLVISCLLKSCKMLTVLSKIEVQTMKELLNAFQIPVHHLSSCTIPIEKDCGHGHFNDSVSWLRSLEQDTRYKNAVGMNYNYDYLLIILPSNRDCVIDAATTLSNELADKDVTCEWMKVLPLLHILHGYIMNADFRPCTKDKVYSIIFCNLKVFKFQAKPKLSKLGLIMCV